VSATRSIMWAVVAMVTTDVLALGHPLSWLHVALIGIAMLGKVLQKAFEKPAQGVVNQKALEHLIDKAIERRPAGRRDATDE